MAFTSHTIYYEILAFLVLNFSVFIHYVILALIFVVDGVVILNIGLISEMIWNVSVH